MREPQRRFRPDRRRSGFAKNLLIAIECFLIPVGEFPSFFGPTVCRFVMQFPAQHLAAQPVPVAFRVNQMQMPDLIHRFRRSHRMPCHHRQAKEALVFPNHPGGECVTPSLFSRQAAGERKHRLPVIQFESLDPRSKLQHFRSL